MNPHRIMLQAGEGVADHYVRADVASTERNADIAAAVKAERERIAGLIEALAQKAADEELRYSRQSFGDCGRHHGVGSDALEELAAALRGEP